MTVKRPAKLLRTANAVSISKPLQDTMVKLRHLIAPQRGIALLELALFAPILIIFAVYLLTLGQMTLNTSEVKSTIDESLKSAILSEVPTNWPQELNTLSAFIAQTLSKFSPKAQPQVLISLARTQEGVITFYNGSYSGTSGTSGTAQTRSSSQLASELEIQAANGELRTIINNLLAGQSSTPSIDLTGIALTKVRLKPPGAPVDMSLDILWPSDYSRLAFLNLKTQF